MTITIKNTYIIIALRESRKHKSIRFQIRFDLLTDLIKFSINKFEKMCKLGHVT